MLSGMARITISLAVILVESTGDTQWALPIFVTVMISKWVGDIFNIGLYDIHIELKHVPMLEPFPEKDFVSMNARDVMSRDVLTLTKVEKVKDLLKILESCTHHGFPVLNPKNGKFLGTLQREMLHRVLYYGYEHGVYQSPDTPLQQPPPMVAYEKAIFSKKALRLKQYPTLDKIEAKLSPEDYKKLIDLKPYLNRGCFSVPERASLSRVYTFFRTMGLRHLPVVNQNGALSGIITRKDLIIPHDGKGHSVVTASSCESTQSRSSVVGTRRASILSEESVNGQV
jgi:chloride channel 7